ncbi:hypothetical protein NCAS_0A05660 [Naumovozyma castellii]|uniref:F-actin-capping protein subunit alpha n=1 Tax=Naumovozyma castellii TaxID=27288 RepID=G0V6M8_NAUCA|nr:hypothetical protein NCAS_0A05660 [Naumovozyma castellii CBS 4309]CCC67124.1 hypothetical protein NCAS_0A05660 [Naumovozyma castellii CBS 4309]
MSEFKEIINEIINDAPPGETQEVYADLLKITSEANADTVLECIESRNVKTVTRVFIPELDQFSLVSEFNADKDERAKFWDPVAMCRFAVDHLHLKAVDVELDVQEKALNDAQGKLYEDLKKYVTGAYPNDVATVGVFPQEEEEDVIRICIVAEKLNPANYWNGSWKSKYHYNVKEETLEGEINVYVHYFEDGNVNFQSGKEVKLQGSDVVQLIKEVETQFENELMTSFTDLNEKQFKNLRRRLPITRSKVNWGKAIGNYRLGRDAAQGL